MAKYTSGNYVISKIVEVVCPIALGALIDTTTFSQTALVVLAICIIQVCVSFGIKSQRPTGSHFSLKEFFQKLSQSQETKKKITLLYIISFIYGSTTMLTTLINVCIMLEYGSNFSLGTITGIFAFVSIFALILMKKFTKAQKRSWLLISCAVITIISSIVFAIMINSVTIIILNGAISVFSIFYKYLFDIYRNGILKEAGLYDEISEHHTVVESLINICRILTFGILMLVGLLKSLIIFKIYTIIAVVLASLMFVLLTIYEKKYALRKNI